MPIQEEETTAEVGNSVDEGGNEEANDDLDGDDVRSSPDVDEESLTEQYLPMKYDPNNGMTSV